MTRLAPLLSKHTMVIDCAGTKEKVCAGVFPLAERYGFRFLGGHPMAGTEFSGIQHALVNMFHGAHYILTPNDQSRPDARGLMERLAVHIAAHIDQNHAGKPRRHHRLHQPDDAHHRRGRVR